MKLILICGALLLAASACTPAPPTTTNTSGQSANANASKGTTALEADTIAREKQVWEQIKNKDVDGFANMLAENMIYVSNDGVYDKAGTVKGVKELTLTDVSLSDWKVVTLDKDAAVVTYTVSSTGSAGEQPIPSTPMRASTAWLNRDGKWLALYHQDSEIRQAPATPPASSTTPAKSSATPASSPAKALSSVFDPILKEQQVWEALKQRDFDAFANFLAEDSLEVEPGGVYDKAGSVKGVSQIDFSGVALSDFKVVKFQNDFRNSNTLVTYMVKGPSPAFNPEGERHSTIWVYRGGKWLATFHQGTPVVKTKSK